MAILRKACRNCTASKRKCVVQLPKCTRCAQRGLECTYDLEPLNAPAVHPGTLPKMSFNPSVCDTPGYCMMKTIRFRSPSIDPAICGPGHPDSFEVLRLGYKPVPELVKAGHPAIFVHPKLQIHCHNHLAALVEFGSVSYESFRRLIQLDLRAVPIKETLTALQALLVYLATFISSVNEVEKKKYLNILSDWTQVLLESAQANMPQDQSSWQAWLFGESVRRTIIMSYGLAMTLSSFNYGYCTGWLFLESLPFDRRAGLWTAESPQAWIAATGVRTGEEVGERLISYHKFAVNLDGSNFDFRGDTFLALLAFSHNGR
ncbi:hypothetical protein BDW59DRAFT_62111 [Aspergillus cavernicola]|uniref:Zn(2)-C6 fungal-type domain-containing protein n=1 Tax=Aspergillus cavernicola TaxID=176166 RepID=A0ABR4IGK2_9EURO